MQDSISRQLAIDAVNEWYRLYAINRTMSNVTSLQDVLRQLPTAQSGFVRCIECKWYEGDIMANPWGVCCHPSWVDGNSGHEVAENGWCYRAERREE